MITPQNIARHELIGLAVRVAGGPNRELLSLEGRVVDESRNTLTIEAGGSEKVVPKGGFVFSFRLPGSPDSSPKWVKVDGDVIVARPEDRIKKKQPKW